MGFINKFWTWYERHLLLTTGVAAGLFVLQLFHLYWLTTDVVLLKLLGEKFFPVPGFFENILILVDYTEIPAIVATSLVYINEFRKGERAKSLLYLLLLNSQWLHILWITDEFVVNQFLGSGGVNIPPMLAWLAIGIDYLELPVIWDTLTKLSKARDLATVKNVLKEDE